MVKFVLQIFSLLLDCSNQSKKSYSFFVNFNKDKLIINLYRSFPDCNQKNDLFYDFGLNDKSN